MLKRVGFIVVAVAAVLGAPVPVANSQASGAAVAGSGVVEIPVPLLDLSGPYAVRLPAGQLAFSLSYDDVGRLVGSGTFAGQPFGLSGKVRFSAGTQLVTLRSNSRRVALGFSGRVESGSLSGTVAVSSRRQRGSLARTKLPVTLPVPGGAKGSVIVAYSFTQDDTGRIEATADVWPFMRCALSLNGTGQVVTSDSGASARIVLKRKKASLVLDGPIDTGGFEATWTLRLPGGLTNVVVFHPIAASGAEVPGAGLAAFHGLVSDARTGQPLADAVVRMTGRLVQTTSGADGRFALPILCNGPAKLTIEKPGYTYAHRVVQATRGLDAAVPPARLLPLDSAVTVVGPAGGTHVNAAGDIELLIPAGAVSEPIEVRATNTDASEQLPAPLPPTTDYTCCVNLQPELQSFSAPVKVRVRNACGFPPGMKIPVGLYRKDGDEWTHETMAVVTEDGQWLAFECLHFSFHDVNLPSRPPVVPPTSRPKENEVRDTGDHPRTCDASGTHPGVGSSVGIRDGELTVEHNLPGYRTLGQSRTVRLVYSSRSANPTALIARDYDIVSASVPGRPGTAPPRQQGFCVRIAGSTTEARYEASDAASRFAYLWDGRNAAGTRMPTGNYPYEIDLSNNYAATYFTASVFGGDAISATGIAARELRAETTNLKGYVTLRNEAESPLGAGWEIGGLQRLLRRADGALVILEGGGGSSIHAPGAGLISTIAGTGEVALKSEEGPAISVPLNSPWGVSVAPDGDLYVADTWANRVVRIDSDGVLTLVAPDGELNHPRGVAVSATGDVFIADTSNHVILRVDQERKVTRLAGGGEPGDLGDGGLAIDARLDSPRAVAVGPTGDVFVADAGNRRIRRIGTDGIISTVVGTGQSGDPGDGGLATAATLEAPSGIALSPSGELVISDSGNARIRKVDAQGVITTVAGTGAEGFSGDGGPATSARVDHPSGVAISPTGEIYFADTFNHRIRRVGLDGRIATVAGDGSGEYSGDEGPPSTAGLSSPRAVAVGQNGDFYVADTNDNRIRAWQAEGTKGQGADVSRLTLSPDGTATRTYPDGTNVTFDPQGFQSSVSDTNGNATTFAYRDAGGRRVLDSITDPVGRVTTFTYDANGMLQAIADPCGRSTNFQVSGAGDLVAVTNPDGSTRAFEYDAEHQLVAQVDAGGMRTAYFYDAHGAVTRVTKAVGSPDEVSREFVASLTQGIVNSIPTGKGTEARPAHRVDPTTIRESFTDAAGQISTSATNEFGSPTESTDALGNTERMERSSRDLVKKLTLPSGRSVRYAYDSRGNPTRITNDATGAVMTILWSPKLSLPVQVTDALGAVTRYEYDDHGNLTRQIDSAGNATTQSFDARGLLTSRTDALGNTTSFEYDAVGNLARATDAAGNHMDDTCDECGRVVEVRDANGNSTQYTYDLMNLRRTIRDAIGGVTRFEYAPAKGTQESTAREPLAVLTSLTDAAGHATTFEYDGLARLVRQTDPLGRSTVFEYDGEDRLIRRTDAKGQVTALTYDASGRAIGMDLAGPDHVTYEYDADGQQTRVADSDSDLRMSYDFGGRLVQVATQAIAGYPATTIGYSYDVADRLVTMTDPSGGITNYAYDLRGLPMQIVDPASHVITFEYDPLGRRSVMTNANGVACAYTYDAEGNLERIAYTRGADSVAQFDYQYDAVGNRVSMADGAGTHAYTLDALYRLTRATHPEAFNPTESYTYDAVGNRLTSHASAADVYDAADQLLADETSTYVYDANGNLATRTNKSDPFDVTTYSFDAEDHLVRVDFPDGQTAAYRYDALGRRIEKNVGGAITRFVHDREDVLVVLDVSNTNIDRVTHGPEVDEPMLVGSGAIESYPVLDVLGTVRGLYESGGNSLSGATYDAFGRIVNSVGPTTSVYSFTSREHDVESGLFDFRARTYDAASGRFLQRDALGLRTDNMNPYVYARNQPTQFTDPSGLCEDGPRTIDIRFLGRTFSVPEGSRPTLLLPDGTTFTFDARRESAINGRIDLNDPFIWQYTDEFSARYYEQSIKGIFRYITGRIAPSRPQPHPVGTFGGLRG